MPGPLPHQWAPEPCLDLVNTRWSDHLGSGQFHDRLPLTVWRRAFLKHWSYRVGDPDDAAAVARLGILRQTVRDALESYIATRRLKPRLRRRLEAEMNRSSLVMRITTRGGVEGLTLERSGTEWDVVTAEIATSAMRLIGEGKLVKVCANPDCSWMFVDQSRSGSRRWCEVSICGSLINVRRHRVSIAGRSGVHTHA